MATGEDAVANRAVFTEEFLLACRSLGRVRLVHRNALGLAEAFVDLSRLQIAEGWANLVLPDVHVHLTPRSLGSVAFRTHSGETGDVPAIWLYGTPGCPLVLIILDQARGREAVEQLAAYGRMVGEFGPFFYLVSRALLPRESSPPSMHELPNGPLQ
jgi:hypothetical protein